MSTIVQLGEPMVQANNESSLSQKLGFAALSCFAYEGLKATVSYLAPHVATAATEAAESAVAVSVALANSTPFALCAGVAGGAIGTALIISPAMRETAASGVRLGIGALSGTANKVHSTVSAIGSGIAEGVNFIANSCPSLLGMAAISYGAYLACKEDTCFS